MSGYLGPYLLGPNDTPENGIYTGDARELAKAIPNASVDLIFTDPPYDRGSLYLYQWVARAAVRVLRPGGFLLAMCGGSYLNQVFTAFDAAELDFYWLYWFHLRGSRTGICWVRGNRRTPITVRGKQVLAYSKGPSLPRCGTIDLIESTAEDKRYHVWGQAEYPVRYYIDCFSAPGDVIWDPLCGGGTTPAMCKIIGRHWLAFDVDARSVEVARSRVEKQPMPFWRPTVVQAEMGL